MDRRDFVKAGALAACAAALPLSVESAPVEYGVQVSKDTWNALTSFTNPTRSEMAFETVSRAVAYSRLIDKDDEIIFSFTRWNGSRTRHYVASRAGKMFRVVVLSNWAHQEDESPFVIDSVYVRIVPIQN